MKGALFSIVIFFLLVIPAHADLEDEIEYGFLLGPVQLFIVNNAAPLTFTYDQHSDFSVSQDIGDINYDLTSNIAWKVTAIITDTTTGGQVADNWDDAGWTLSVNGVTLNESTNTIIDSDGAAIDVTGATWEVLLDIPWPESVSNPDCAIILTAETI